ncbi:MAG: lysozyme, partial [Frankiales bacterium]|nr:lysozyme [Frankiales bacterium]
MRARPRLWPAAVFAGLTMLATTVLGSAAAASAATLPLVGPDVSGWQHSGGATIDWAKVRTSSVFAIVKATEGAYYVSPYYAGDIKG